MRLALRRLAASPIFSLFSIITLALGIGVVTAVYSVMYVTFARPLGIEDAARIFVLTRASAINASAPAAVSWPDYQDFAAGQRSFSDLFAWSSVGDVLAGPVRSDMVRAEAVSGRYFSVLGVRPALGRAIQPADDQPGATPVIVLSDVIWRYQFNADPAVVGTTVRFGGEPFEIVGVAPEGFRGIRGGAVGEIAAWIPLPSRTGRGFEPARRGYASLFVAGRLASYATEAGAIVEASTIAARLDESAPLPVRPVTNPAATPIQPRRTWQVTQLDDSTGVLSNDGMRIVVALPFLVLLIACTNLANLILSRGSSRRHEYAVRGSLGATRARLVREHLTETAILAVAGGGLGILTAHTLLVWAVSSMREYMDALTPGFPLMWQMEPVVFAAVGVCVLLALAVGGVVPALTLTRVDPGRTLTVGDPAATLPRWRGRSNLIALQLGVSTALVLITLTFVRFLVFDPPFRNFVRYDGLEQIAMAGVVVDPRRGGMDQLVARVTQELQRMPEVASASVSTNAPYESIRTFGGGFGAGHTIEATQPGAAFPVREPRRRISALYVTPGFDRTAGLQLVGGRFLTADDATSSARPIVVDEALARFVFGSVDVVGRTMQLRRSQGDGVAETLEATVVGVATVLGHASDDTLARPEVMYAPFEHRPTAERDVLAHWRIVLMARSRDADATPLAGALRSALRGVDPDVAIAQAGRADLLAAGPLALLEFAGFVFGGLAALALTLSMAGLYGVLSHVVDRRTRELAIRIALGAGRARVARLILRQGFRPIMEGLFIGLGVALVVHQFVQQGMTATLSPIGAAVFALAAVPLLAVGLLACYLPARRASAVDPLHALRQL